VILRRSLSLAAMIFSAAICTSKIAGIFTVYYEPLEESANGRPPWKHLTTIADPNTLESISSVLSKKGLQFGKFITPKWPELSFTNAYFGLRVGPREEFSPKENTCFFWYEANSFIDQAFERRLARYEMSYRLVKKHYKASCIQYPAKEEPAAQRSLCNICFAKENKSIDIQIKKMNWNGPHDFQLRNEQGRYARWKGEISIALSPVLNDPRWKCHLEIDKEHINNVRRIYFNESVLQRIGDVWPIDSHLANGYGVNKIEFYDTDQQHGYVQIAEKDPQQTEMKRIAINCLQQVE
jgi:hypothetical protein